MRNISLLLLSCGLLVVAPAALANEGLPEGIEDAEELKEEFPEIETIMEEQDIDCPEEAYQKMTSREIPEFGQHTLDEQLEKEGTIAVRGEIPPMEDQQAREDWLDHRLAEVWEKFNSKAEAEEMTWEATHEDRRVSLGLHSNGYLTLFLEPEHKDKIDQEKVDDFYQNKLVPVAEEVNVENPPLVVETMPEAETEAAPEDEENGIGMVESPGWWYGAAVALLLLVGARVAIMRKKKSHK